MLIYFFVKGEEMAKKKREEQKRTAAEPQKRPGWVLVISIVYFIFGVTTLLSLYLLHFGHVTPPPEYQAYLKTLTDADHVFNVLIAVANTCGAVALFLLRKAAFPFFLTSLSFNVLVTIWRIINKGFAQAFVGGSPVGFLLGSLILLFICIYTNNLTRSKVLR